MAGTPEDEAKLDLCRAMGDGKIAVRVIVGSSVYGKGNVTVPPHLDPSDFDWSRSCPLRPWRIGPKLGQHYTWIGGWEEQRINLIELSTSDVMEVLCAATIDRGMLEAAGITTESEKTRTRPLTRKAALQFATEYIAGEISAGHDPTLTGLDAAAMAAGMRGGREWLREAFRQLRGGALPRGRPRNPPPKNAKK
jgi:hypothetical protein